MPRHDELARRAGAPLHVTRRVILRIASAVLVVLVGVALLPTPVTRAAQSLPLPAEPGSEWRVLSGYNTATHSQADANDPYALDIERVDAPTDGSIVYSPASGTVQYADSKCVGVRDASNVSILMCHLYPDANLRGKTIARGQRLGVVAPPGEAGNNGVAHIHIALSGQNRTPLPFSGTYALEGQELTATEAAGAYTGTSFHSTLRRAPLVYAGSDLTVRPRDGVTLSASIDNPEGGALSYTWAQAGGSSVVMTGTSGLVAQFTAPAASTTLQFRFTATELATGEQFSDTVSVRVSGTATVSSGTPSAGSRSGSGAGGVVTSGARLVAGSVPAGGGFGLVVFSGGTTDQLVTATGCPRETAAYWAVVDGGFVIFVPASRVTAVNAEWDRVIGGSIPANMALLARCR